MNTPPTPYTTKVSIPLPTDEQLGPVAAAKVKAANDLNVSRMFAGTDDLLDPLAALVQAVFQARGIDPKLRELIILRTAKLVNCPYEWQANAVMAKNTGCTQQQIDAMAADGFPAGMDERSSTVIRATDEMTRDGTLTDATLQSLRDNYDDTICRKLLMMIAWFNLLSRFLNACRVPLETGEKLTNKTSPLG